MLENLHALLMNETYPQVYVHKFIGSHTPVFLQEVEKLKVQFAYLDLQIETKQSKKGDYISYNFIFQAGSAEEIILLMKATTTMQDLKVIL